MKITILLILLFQTLLSAQLSNNVKKLSQPLYAISYAESSHVGFSGEESKIYNHFKKLAKIANNNELYFFAKNGSNALRLYSSQELFKRNDIRFLEIYNYYLKNPLIMKYQIGCNGLTKNIAFYLKNEVSSAQEIISIRDSLLKDKKDNLIKNQLKQINEKGYGKLSQKNIEYYLKEIEKIDSKKL